MYTYMYIYIYLYIYIYIYNVVRMHTDLLWLNATYIVIENRSRCPLGYKPYEHRKIESRSVFNMQHTIQQEQSSRSNSGATPCMHRPPSPPAPAARQPDVGTGTSQQLPKRRKQGSTYTCSVCKDFSWSL